MTRLNSLPVKKAAALQAWGVESVLDLLTTYPRRYIDRSRQADVADLADLAVGEAAAVLATVATTHGRRTRHGRSLVELTVRDHTGSVQMTFFNQPWRAKQLRPGTEALFWGKVDEYRGARRMTNPVVDVLVAAPPAPPAPPARDAPAASPSPARTGSPGTEIPEPATVAQQRRTLRIVPVYPASAKVNLTSWEVGGWVAEAIRRVPVMADPLPERWRDDLGLLSRGEAFRTIHLPGSLRDAESARRRLAFDELLRLQLALVLRRRAMEQDARAIRHAVSPRMVTGSAPPPAGRAGSNGIVRAFLESLPFALTGAQRRALASIFAEMAGPLPMHRLLQGDVGSGKTVVALAALLGAVEGGHQGALMVPTEVLAEQHLMAVRSFTDRLRVPDRSRLGGERALAVELLTGKGGVRGQARVKKELAEGSIDLLVGTQALLTDDVRFHSLGMAVIDEQHRFGVEQRAALREKGRLSTAGEGADPDLLVMTATPIPRTAAMVLFGDLDMVVLDELPPRRNPITTVWARTPLEEVAAWERVRGQVAAGKRAYVVCPLVEGSDRVVARSAIDECERLGASELAGLRLGLLHGQMSPADKESTMAAFRAGEVQVLVATTVIEVGVDVPQATVIVVEDADRFGIAQLHQLRGRVGRGEGRSWCYLLARTDDDCSEAARRLEALERSTDGFELADVDLELRGEGTILGTRQQGRSDLRLARLRKDADLLEAARRVAESLTEGDPVLAAHPLLRDELSLFLDPEEESFLFKS